jgi:hypothetical protein
MAHLRAISLTNIPDTSIQSCRKAQEMQETGHQLLNSEVQDSAAAQCGLVSLPVGQQLGAVKVD